MTMTAAPSQGNANPLFSRTGFLKNAAISLVGAGVGAGVAGQSLERAAAAEPLVETCEAFVGQLVRSRVGVLLRCY